MAAINKAAVGATALVISLATPAAAAGNAAFHNSLITLDTHLDTPASLARPGWNIAGKHSYAVDYTQVDLPRMVKGGLDGGFWAIYTPVGPLDDESLSKARDFAIMRGIAIREMVAHDPAHFELATTAEDAAKIAAKRKRIVYMSIENASPLGHDPTMLRVFYAMGVRLLGFAHFMNNQFADSSTDSKGPKWHGLSPEGRELLKEANRLGVILDASHSSDDVFDDFIKYSKAPFILSHSGCKAIFDHPRNLDDDRIRALAKAGGVIQINSFSRYLKAMPRNPEREKAMSTLADPEGPPMTAAAYKDMLVKRRAIDARYPPEQATFDDFMVHLLHALKVAGPDHVGIGLDWDGGGGVKGLQDVQDLPKITAALLKAGYSKDDVAKIWSDNVLRVMAAAQAEGVREQATVRK